MLEDIASVNRGFSAELPILVGILFSVLACDLGGYEQRSRQYKALANLSWLLL